MNFIFLQILQENFSPAGEFFPNPTAARRGGRAKKRLRAPVRGGQDDL